MVASACCYLKFSNMGICTMASCEKYKRIQPLLLHVAVALLQKIRQRKIVIWVNRDHISFLDSWPETGALHPPWLLCCFCSSRSPIYLFYNKAFFHFSKLIKLNVFRERTWLYSFFGLF